MLYNCVILCWKHERSFTWFEMVDERYPDGLWYENFRVKRQTFACILEKVWQDLLHEETNMRAPISLQRSKY